MKLATITLAALLGLASITFAQDSVPPAAPAAPAPPAAPLEPEKKPRLKIMMDSGHVSDELKDKLTPEQVFELEMARVRSKSSFSDVEDIAVPLGFFVMVFALFAVPAYLRFRQRRIMHETIRLMVEKGQPIPPELFIEKPAKRSDLRRGIVLCGLGLGLVVFFLCVSPNVWGIGAIPFFLGVGHLVAWRLERGKEAAAAGGVSP